MSTSSTSNPSDARVIAALRRKLKAAEAKIERLENAWQSEPSTWRAHVEKYGHRRAIESAARKHGQKLGAAFVELLAERLAAVDVDHNGARLTREAAARLVAAWAREGKASR